MSVKTNLEILIIFFIVFFIILIDYRQKSFWLKHDKKVHFLVAFLTRSQKFPFHTVLPDSGTSIQAWHIA